ncbi:MAG: C1 family peptidase, partial [Candidatus Thermoplasmatota archaeon]|nr:C1 family peptidase [Candidatus Thermoplasmatota archaeon]
MSMNESGPTIQTWILAVILLATSAFAFAGGQFATLDPEAPAKDLADIQTDSMFQYESHVITAEEVERLKAEFGVRDPQKNYNILFDGLGTGLAPPTEAEWQDMIGTSWTDGVNEPMLEPMVDHSQEPYFPKVRSQQSQGSCSAWSVAYYINGYNQAKDLNWTDASTGNNNHLMSPAFVYNKANSGFDSGSWPSGNMEVIKTVGNSIWAEMPYNPSDAVSWGDEDAWRSAPEYRGLDYQSTDPSNTDVIKAWVAEGYAISIVLDAGNYGNGLGSGDDTINSTEHVTGNPNHANTIVGFNDTREDDGEIGAFKVVNSWGAGWGSAWGGNGYYWMTYEAADELPNIAIRFRDRIDYEPSLLGIVNMNPQGGRNASVTLGIGPISDPAAT